MTYRLLHAGIVAASLAGAAVAGLAADPAAAKDITIGVIGPLSGPTANSGIAMRQAYEAAAKSANEAGGIAVDGENRMIRMIFEDSASRPEMGVSAAQKLLTRDNVDILVGDTIASSVTLALMEVAPSFGKFVMSGQPVSIEIANKIQADPQRFANFWKGNFNSDAYAVTLHDTVSELIENGQFDPGDRRIAFIIEDTDYGKSNLEFTQPLFEADGWTTVSSETVPLAHADFYPQLAKLRTEKPEVLVSIFTSVNSGIALVKQIAEQGLDTLHMAVYYPIRPEFLDGAGEAANGLLWTPLQFDPINNAAHKEFADMVNSQIGVPGDGDHAQAYCQITALLDNIRKAGSIDPDRLSAAFATTDSTCVIARYVYDTETHTPRVGADYLPVPMAQIQDGQNLVIWPEVAATTTFAPLR